MKITDKDKPVHTVPKGVWESNHPISEKKDKTNNVFTTSTDLQGNGYPINKQSK